MKPVTAFTAIFVSLLFVTSCGSGSGSFSSSSSNRLGSEEPKSPEALRMELKALEEASPLDYISHAGIELDPQQVQTRSAGFFRDAEYAPDGAIISGSFHSTATLARFKDVRLKLSFYSQTETLIDEKTYTIYEYLEPNSSVSFSFKIASYPEAMEHFKAEVVGAMAVD